MKSVLILGAGVMQGPAIRAAGECGYRTVLVDGDPNALHAASADEFHPVDLKDKDGLLALARSIPELVGVFTAGTDFSASVAYVANALGLPGIPYETALDASDKARMRAKLAQAAVPVPAWVAGSKHDDPLALSASLGLRDGPWVVKPVDNMGARGCSLARNKDELVLAWRTAVESSRSGRAIIEDYLDGPEFSIDALVCGDSIAIRGVADRQVTFEPYFVELGHTMPSAYDQDVIDEVLSVFKRGVKALGISLGAAKGDIKFTKNGAFVGEIAARLSGGFMSGWTYPYASGQDPAREAIALACGDKPMLYDGSCSLVSAERAWISIPGTVKRVVGLGTAMNIQYVKNVFPRAKAGDRVVFPVNNVQKCGNVISQAADRNAAEEAALRAARSVLVELQSGDRETEAFLAQPYGQWPPLAFADVSAMMLAQVESIPDIMRDKRPVRSLGWAPLLGIRAEHSKDWLGRSISESLEAVTALTGATGSMEADLVLGRLFWKALFRGGYQAAAWVLSTALSERQ